VSLRLTRMVIAVAVAAALSAIAWPIYGTGAFLTSLEILAPLGAVTTLLADLLASHRLWIRGIHRQLGALALLTVAQLAAAVGLFAALMFVSSHDAFFVALATGYAVLVGVTAARLVARRALTDLDAVRAAVMEVGEGSRELRIPTQGKDELALLAADVEAMAAKLATEPTA